MNPTAKRCPRCGSANPIPARFCNGCGQGLTTDAADPVGRLADRIDADARRRWNEVRDPRRTWTPAQWRGNAVACWVCVGLFVLIFLIAWAVSH